MTPEPFASAGPHALTYLPGEGPDLILSCASIGHDPSRAPSPEWLRTTRPHPTLFLTDQSRSWATAPGLPALLAEAAARIAPRRILALGASMGAFVALAASRMIPLHAVIAIGPQHQPAAPWESRWRAHTASLPPDLTAPRSQAALTFTLHGMADDARQAEGFAGPNRILFSGQAHSTLAAHLKPAMPGLIAAAFAHDRRRFLRLTTTAGGQHERTR